MSTTRDIIVAIGDLLTSLDELLKTDTVDAVVSLARRLGVGDAVKKGIETLQGLFLKLVAFLDKAKQAFLAVTQVPALMEPLDAILEVMEPMVAGVTDVVRRIQSTASTVIANLPKPEDIKLLQDRFQTLNVTLGGYREKLSAAPALAAGGKP